MFLCINDFSYIPACLMSNLFALVIAEVHVSSLTTQNYNSTTCVDLKSTENITLKNHYDDHLVCKSKVTWPSTVDFSLFIFYTQIVRGEISDRGVSWRVTCSAMTSHETATVLTTAAVMEWLSVTTERARAWWGTTDWTAREVIFNISIYLDSVEIIDKIYQR